MFHREITEGGRKVTLEELEALPDTVLMADQIAPHWKLNPDTIRDAVRGGEAPFSSMAMGNQVRIPKMPYIKFMRGELPVFNITINVYQK